MKFIGIKNGDGHHERVNLEKVEKYYKYVNDGPKYTTYRITFRTGGIEVSWNFESQKEMEKIWDKVEKTAGIEKLDESVSL